ncbi:MAG: (Na+)-NQR maturation NqrM [Vulcanimicrobiaceae bacterium]
MTKSPRRISSRAASISARTSSSSGPADSAFSRRSINGSCGGLAALCSMAPF